jgi:hypothetical protein
MKVFVVLINQHIRLNGCSIVSGSNGRLCLMIVLGTTKVANHVRSSEICSWLLQPCYGLLHQVDGGCQLKNMMHREIINIISEHIIHRFGKP